MTSCGCRDDHLGSKSETASPSPTRAISTEQKADRKPSSLSAKLVGCVSLTKLIVFEAEGH